VAEGSGGIAEKLLREKYWVGNPIYPTQEALTEVHSDRPSSGGSLTMCGICGVLNLHGQPLDVAVGQRMMDLLWHRGPDDSGRLVLPASTAQTSPSIFLGHCRLKIIDLSEAARQPLANEDETIWVIFNGEIYNFLDLRHDLEQRGHVFRSRSDTETIVHAYEAFGDDFLSHLDGMFAFALWDARRQRLVLARDRSGKKPLFYAFDGTHLAFASEIKAILACPWVERRMAVEHLPELLTFGYVSTPRTLYEGIFQLPPASYAVVDRDGIKGPFWYWRLTFSSASNGHSPSAPQAAQRVRELLTAAVQRRLISDVPLGALLSGGLDSSIVVGLMSKLIHEPVRTFTIGMADEPSFDERPYAEIAARHFKTDHTEFVIKADAVALMERLIWHHDQPYGDSSAIPTYLVSRLARQQVSVVLNGDGGDEVFAGYDRFLGALLAQRVPGWLAPIGRAFTYCLPRQQGYYSVRRRLERFPEERFLGWITCFQWSNLKELLRPELMASLEPESLQTRFWHCYAVAEGLPLLHRLLQVNFMTYLPDDLHVKMDRLSMANALETRSPMLDTALMEYVASLPPQLKIHRTQLKYVLRLACHDVLPRALRNRKKHGFGVPLGIWFRRQLRGYVEDTLLSPQARLRAYCNQECIRTLVREHVEGVRPHWDRLWVLLTCEVWLRMLEAEAFWTPRRADMDDGLDIATVTRHSYA
jgi:asparagine synthase (glutamine-hydrolysing)